MVVTVFGLPCVKTDRTLMNVEEAVGGFRRRTRVTWVGEIEEMNRWGVHQTPTVCVNNKPKSHGRIPSIHEVKTWIEEEMREVGTLRKRRVQEVMA
jgi:hypothetical protein